MRKALHELRNELDNASLFLVVAMGPFTMIPFTLLRLALAVILIGYEPEEE